MLVLTRKCRETIQIGDDVVITIVRMKGNAVQVGIEAPRDIRVTRGEIEREEDARPSAEVTVTADAETQEDEAETGIVRLAPLPKSPLRRSLGREMKGSRRLPIRRRRAAADRPISIARQA
jgi:carbon storage regulator CsrA